MHRQLPLVCARDHEQVGRERGEPLGLLCGRPDRILELGVRARMAKRELELGPKQGERRAELVRGVGDESPLVLEGRLEPLEHLVERLGEPRHLVARRRYGQPVARSRRRDRACLAPHRLDRPKRGARQQVPAERRQQHCQRQRQEQLPAEILERLRPCAERGREHERARLLARARYRQQPPASGVAGDRHRRAHRAAACHHPRLARGEERRQARRVRERHSASTREHLGEAHSAVGFPVDRWTPLVEPERHRGRLGEQGLVGGTQERRADPDVDECTDRCQHDRHREREREGQAEPDRDPIHPALRRYPTPRTVSIEWRPNGRSTFSRR